MTHDIQLIRFLPPWRGQDGIQQFTFSPELGQLSEKTPLKAKKILRKNVKNIDGLLLRPTWPTRNSLVLYNTAGGTYLQAINGRAVDTDTPRMDLNDPSLSLQIRERGLYRTFILQTDTARYVFRDLAGRLVGPQRVADQVFAETDFSPFARLINMLNDPQSRARLLRDFDRHRFKYSHWTKTPMAVA